MTRASRPADYLFHGPCLPSTAVFGRPGISPGTMSPTGRDTEINDRREARLRGRLDAPVVALATGQDATKRQAPRATTDA